MGRPRKPLQQRPNGIWVVQLWLDGKRRVKSLETRDSIKAHKRAAQAIAELEAEAQAASEGGKRWTADEPAIEWDLDREGNVIDKPIPTTWGAIAEPEQIKQIGWLELVREAESVLKRKTRKGYSDSWHRNIGIAIKQVPFTLMEATPQTIRSWIKQMEGEGLSGLTINSKCSLLAGLVNTGIRSGLLHGMNNAFTLVDYTAGEANHIPPAVEEDYRGLKGLAPTLKKSQLIPVLIQAYCGTRISEVKLRNRADFDLVNGTMEVVVGTAKNKSSERTIPLPPAVLDLLQDFDFNWSTPQYINKKIKSINPNLSSHSFRHGLTKLSRDLQAGEIAIEALQGHRLTHSEQANRYGGKYGAEAMRKAVKPVWDKLDEWIGA